jgi:hypothetical protein
MRTYAIKPVFEKFESAFSFKIRLTEIILISRVFADRKAFDLSFDQIFTCPGFSDCPFRAASNEHSEG